MFSLLFFDFSGFSVCFYFLVYFLVYGFLEFLWFLLVFFVFLVFLVVAKKRLCLWSFFLAEKRCEDNSLKIVPASDPNGRFVRFLIYGILMIWDL